MKPIMTLTAAAIVVLLVLAPPTPASAVPSFGLQFTNQFFKELIEGLSHNLNATIANTDFPASGGDCPSVSLNEGKWIRSVGFPTHDISVAMSSGGTTGVEIVLGGATVTGLGGSKAWTSNTMARYVYDGELQFESCFQVCFGSSPFAATTDFKWNFDLSGLKKSEKPQVDVTHANLVYPPFGKNWTLENITRCVGSNTEFDEKFNSGLSGPLTAGMPLLISLMQEGFNSILDNATSSGFQTLESISGAANGGSGILLRDDTLPTSPSASVAGWNALPFQTDNLTKPEALRMATLTAASPLPASAGGNPTRCLSFSKECSNGAVFGGEKMSLKYGRCGACLLVGPGNSDEMLATFAYVASATSENNNNNLEQARPMQVQTSSSSSVVTHHMATLLQDVPVSSWISRTKRSAPSQPLAAGNTKELKKIFPNLAATFLNIEQQQQQDSGNTTLYLSTKFFSEVLATTSTEVASLIKAVHVEPLATSPLPHAPNCNVNHRGFRWEGVPDSILVNATNIVRDETAKKTLMTVRLPQLKSLRGTGNFSVSCAIDLPIGAPFVNSANGFFTIEQETVSNDFEFKVEVADDGSLTIVSSPAPKFTSSVGYPPDEEELLFQDYVNDLFITTIGTSVANQTAKLLLDNTTDVWLAPLQEVIRMINLPKTMTAASTFSNEPISLKMDSVHAPLTSATDITQLIPQELVSPEANSGLVKQLTSSIPPFPLPGRVCHNFSAICSSMKPLGPPLETSLQMQSCTTCLQPQDGVVLFSVQFNNNFHAAATSAPLVFQKKNGEVVEALEQEQERSSDRRNQPKTVARRQLVDASEEQRETILYLGNATLSQASTLASAQITKMLTSFTHDGASKRDLPYLEQQCTVTHESLSWQGIPAASAIEAQVVHVKEEETTSGAVVARVQLTGLPRTLSSNIASWTTFCDLDVNLPVNFQQTRQGTSQATIEFEEEVFAIDVLISLKNLNNQEGEETSSSSAVTLQVASHNLTQYKLSSTYSYQNGDSFAFDPYLDHFWSRTVLEEIRSSFSDLMLQTAGGLVSEQLVSFLSASQSAASCSLKTWKNTHLVIGSGPKCGSELPTPGAAGTMSASSSDLGASELYYSLDAGPFPVQNATTGVAVIPQGAATQEITGDCTSMVPLLGVLNASSVAVSKCQTLGAAHKERLVITTLGTVILP